MLWIAKISLNTWMTAMDLWFQNYLTSNLNVTDKKVDSLFQLEQISSILIDEMERRQT